MRPFGSIDPLSMVPVPPDTRLSLLLTAATGHAFDYPANTGLVRVTVGSTISGVHGPAFFSFSSTSAALPTTGGAVSTVETSGGIGISVAVPRMFQVPGGSTGFSVIAASSYSILMEFWKK